MHRFHPEIFRMQPEPGGIVVRCRATEAVAAVETEVDGRLAAGGDRLAAPFQASRPDLRADEIVGAPRRTGLEDDDLLPRAGELRRQYAARCAGTDDRDIGFLDGRHYHFLVGAMCG